MIEKYIKEYIRLIGSVSLNQTQKDRIADYLIGRCEDKKEKSGIYVAAASAVAFLAVSTILIARGKNIDRM